MARLCECGHRATLVYSSEDGASRGDLIGNAVHALEVDDPGSRGFAPRRSRPAFLQFERNKAEQLRFGAA